MNTRMHRGRILAAARAIVIAGALVLVASGSGFAQTVCEPTIWDLTAGQYTDVGSVTVSNDDVNVYVTYTLDYPDATFGWLHLWVGSDLANLPVNPQGIPVPGQFCSASGGACYLADGLTTYTFTVPFADLALPGVPDVCDTELVVVTHAEVDMDGDPDNGCEETAFGGDVPGDGPRWWMYGQYTVCCGDEPPATDSCETAFAKGGWVWTTRPKANPEGLPSLELTRNRWGWAFNLGAPGTIVADLWAGAGLNDTSKGVLVGDLAIFWDGAAATVTYTVDAGFDLAEVHLYAGDTPPTTIAPGQYGYLDAPDATTYTFTAVPLVDTDGDGVWLVAHAVVCAVE